MAGTEKGMMQLTKKELRRQYKELRNDLTDDLVNEYNKKIRERLFDLEQFMECTMLFTYVSFGKEADTHEIIRKALQMNKQVYVPKVSNECHTSRDNLLLSNMCHASQDTHILNEMNFYEIHSLDNLIRSNYGILEPEGDIRYRYESSQSDMEKRLMLIPGLVFDEKGNRIGYGAGYYDRYLARFPDNEWVKIALAYDFQVIDKLTVGLYDVPADYILTPDRLIVCKDKL